MSDGDNLVNNDGISENYRQIWRYDSTCEPCRFAMIVGLLIALINI